MYALCLLLFSLKHRRFVFVSCMWRGWRCGPVSWPSVEWFQWPAGLLCWACVSLFAVGIVSFFPIPQWASPTLSPHTKCACFFYLVRWTMISFQEKEVRGKKKKKSADELICLPRRLSALESRQAEGRVDAECLGVLQHSKQQKAHMQMYMHEFRVYSALDAACC